MKFPSLTFEWDIDEHLNRYIPAPRLYRLPYWASHFLGYRRTDDDGFTTRDHKHSTILFWSFIGEFVSLIIIEAVFMNIGGELKRRDVPYIFPAFSASAVILFNTVDSPLGMPRAFILGQFFCSIIAVAIPKLFSLHPDADRYYWIAGALACSIATAFMRFTNTIHPPAGATALLPSINKQARGLGWWYIPAVLLMSAIMLVTALLINNIQRQYPEYWWTPLPLGKVPKEDDVEVGRRVREEIERESTRRKSESSGGSGEEGLWEEKSRVDEGSLRGSNRTLVDAEDMEVNRKENEIVIDLKGAHVPGWIASRMGVVEARVLEQLHGMILQRCRENADLVSDTDEDGDTPSKIRSRAHSKGH